MNKVIATAVIAIAGSTVAFADNGPSFRAAPAAKQAPVVSNEVVSAEAKSTGRSALHGQGHKQAGTSAGMKTISSFKTSDWTSNARVRG